MTKIYKGERVEVLQEGYNLTKILKIHGEECFVFSDKLTEVVPTREERYAAQVAVIQECSISYQIAGWLVSHESNFHVSTPPKQLDQTVEELIEHGVDFELGFTLTESTEATQGRSYSVVTDNHGLGDQLFLETGIISTTYHDNLDKVSMQAKQFILDFLLDELRFKLGKNQNNEEIRAKIPVKFLSAFDAGVRLKRIAEVA
jgi:hypothetical protein